MARCRRRPRPAPLLTALLLPFSLCAPSPVALSSSITPSACARVGGWMVTIWGVNLGGWWWWWWWWSCFVSALAPSQGNKRRVLGRFCPPRPRWRRRRRRRRSLSPPGGFL